MTQHIKCNCPVAVLVLRRENTLQWCNQNEHHDNNFKLVDINPAKFIIVQLNILMNVKEWIF